MNVLLIGPRASGKTSVGRALAERLGFAFVDLDDAVLARLRRESVRAVWDELGEAAWRDGEAAEIAILLARDGQVIALGGGTPMVPAARAAIDAARRARSALVVYLKAPTAQLVERLRRHPGDRPSLTGVDPAFEAGAVLALREPTYLEIADHIVDAAAGGPDDIAAAIANAVADARI
jgi:shikimate kinase